MTDESGSLVKAHSMAKIVVLDIETVPNPYMQCFLPPFVTPTAENKPGNISKPATIEKWIVKETKKCADAYEASIGRMALDVDFARIDAIAYKVVDYAGKATEVAMLAPNLTAEADMLRQFWTAMRAMGTPRLCGYNILGFDLPVITRRSWVLGVEPIRYKARRYSDEQVIDVMQLLYNWGQAPLQKSGKYRSLKSVCEMYGIHNPLPEIHGGLYADLDDETKLAYNKNDVDMTWDLAFRMYGVYWS